MTPSGFSVFLILLSYTACWTLISFLQCLRGAGVSELAAQGRPTEPLPVLLAVLVRYVRVGPAWVAPWPGAPLLFTVPGIGRVLPGGGALGKQATDCLGLCEVPQLAPWDNASWHGRGRPAIECPRKPFSLLPPASASGSSLPMGRALPVGDPRPPGEL